MQFDYTTAKFSIGATSLKQLPNDNGVEIAFAGRSNAGKSSVLNSLTKNKSLAKTSKIPGRTQQLNVFNLDENHRLVDLPGYGYAQVPAYVSEKWQKLLQEYFTHRKCLYGCVLIADIRHPLKPYDCELLEWAGYANLPVHIVLNKADKLTKQNKIKNLANVKEKIKQFSGNISTQICSAKTSEGINSLQKNLDCWFNKHEILVK